MAHTDNRFQDATDELGGLEQMSLEEAQNRKEQLQAERDGTQGTVTQRVRERAEQEANAQVRGMTLLQRVAQYGLELIGRGPEWKYQRAVAQMQQTVDDAKRVANNGQELLKEYTTLQKDLQHKLRIDQQILSCNIAQISHYERIATGAETKLQQADAASMYGMTTTEALALHTELSGAQEKLIELHADSNMLTMYILTGDEELVNLTNTIVSIQQQTTVFNQQRIALEAYNRQADAQARLVKGLNGVAAMHEIYQECAIVKEGVVELQAKLRSPVLEPLPLQDRIRSPVPPKKSIANRQYWQENMGRALPYMRSVKKE